jgi:hypothetical protein
MNNRKAKLTDEMTTNSQSGRSSLSQVGATLAVRNRFVPRRGMPARLFQLAARGFAQLFCSALFFFSLRFDSPMVGDACRENEQNKGKRACE